MWLHQAKVLTDRLGDGTGLSKKLVTIEAVGQVTGVRGCRGEKGQLTPERFPLLSPVGGQLSSFQIRQKPLSLGNEMGSCPLSAPSQPIPSILIRQIHTSQPLFTYFLILSFYWKLHIRVLCSCIFSIASSLYLLFSFPTCRNLALSSRMFLQSLSSFSLVLGRMSTWAVVPFAFSCYTYSM